MTGSSLNLPAPAQHGLVVDDEIELSNVGNSALADRRQVVGLDRSPHDHGRRHLADLVDGPDLNDWFVRADPDRLPTIAPAEIELK